ncbi:conserved hypothetical protein [Uncinocarpus reesii 1704]|uniref:Elongator complex protein 2 n=1 Tax=Uncinocarpus reesii (strain UAMH 1704) TaxID=336963 RepID=C4JPG5_UNCRE|nr:uncharacterized protein UREG_03136 [Uncinocarpus reesii 1704]EEP78291.1 conserved hypothetical protein [Uncinocarpus reesii 1704]
MDTYLNADVVANSPRFRRKSSTFVDAIHDLRDKPEIAPAQLYSTESGRLFHSGRIVIITVGLPARGKTSQDICAGSALKLAYSILGIIDVRPLALDKTCRRTISSSKASVSFNVILIGHLSGSIDILPKPSASSVLMRQKIVKKCRDDIYHFLSDDNGQVAIYDAVNPIAAGRRSLAKEFGKYGIETLFIESWCDDEKIIEENVQRVKISSPDYKGWDPKDAVKDYLARISARIPQFQTMEEKDLNYIKMINAGDKMMINNCSFGYLHHRIVFYLLNLHIQNRRTYFARAGTSLEADSYKADASLSPQGEDYARKMTQRLLEYREEERQAAKEQGDLDAITRPLIVWTSTRRRTTETAQFLHKKGFKTRHRSQLSQLNPGVCEKMSERRIREEFPDEVAQHDLDPYHHRYPRAESYHDLAVRLEPIILELERERNDLLIIAHESVLRVLYGYLMACNAADIPFLSFPRDEIIEVIFRNIDFFCDNRELIRVQNVQIIPGSYSNEAKRIHVPDLPPEIIPGSPEDIKIPVPPSGAVSPMPDGSSSALTRGGTPQSGFRTPRDPERISQLHVEDVVNEVLEKMDILHRVIQHEQLPPFIFHDVLTEVLDEDPNRRGVYALLVGHTDTVNAVKFYTPPSGNPSRHLLITGSVDRTIRIWAPNGSTPLSFTLATTLQGHDNSINCIAVAEKSDVFVSRAADGLTLVIPVEALVLALGGTRSIVQVYVAQDSSKEVHFELKATLTGHEGWIRSLAFTAVEFPGTQDFLLASASQDKYIRLWRVHPGKSAISAAPQNAEDAILGGMQALSNKAHTFESDGAVYSITFEALLFGHEDWIYSIAWNPNPEKLQLMSSSADNSLVIWESDPVSGAWYSGSRMGEISVQKGSTTATGSAGGFWVGLWAPDGDVVISLGRTGSWRSWRYESDADAWVQIMGITGHVRSVNDIVWEPSGGYLLSTSADQTTRLHAKWSRDGHDSWHEFSRPQIHGYDLNCITSLGPTRFVSGADEKLLRVFNETKSIAQLLERLSGFAQSSQEEMAEAANIPVLGLSNKAMDDADVEEGDENETNGMQGGVPSQAIPLDLDHPPLEDHLAKYTLWPEHEKLYGHGYEISAVAASNNRSVIATACKASSIDHAVIRLYDTQSWREIRPPLAAHTLTITALKFSPDDQYLLSVGRDRQWAVFERDAANKSLYQLLTSNLKAHSRMILSASWAPHPTTKVFATAGRDKSVKLWSQEGGTFVCKSNIAIGHPVTAIDFLPTVVDDKFCLAVGDDSGAISVHVIAMENLMPGNSVAIPKFESPSKSITQVLWRPSSTFSRGDVIAKYQLAVASDDSSVRIYNIDGVPS